MVLKYTNEFYVSVLSHVKKYGYSDSDPNSFNCISSLTFHSIHGASIYPQEKKVFQVL